MVSKTQITKRTQKKRNPEIVETIKLAKKNGLLDLGKKLSGPKRLYNKINIGEINKLKDEKILIIGKVLGQGDINKKIKVVGLSFSKQARDKLKKTGCEIKTIKQEIKDNPKLEGMKIL